MQSKNTISAPQFGFSVAAFLGSSTLLTALCIQILGHESWIAILPAIAIALFFTVVYGALMRRFPRKSLFAIHRVVFGKSIGELVNIGYIAFFGFVTCVNVRDVGNFFVGYIMPETPVWVLLVLFMVSCAIGAATGSKTIMRTACLLVGATFLLFLLNCLMLIGNMDFSHFKPLFVHTPMEYVQSTWLMAAIPFCEIIVFLVFAGDMKEGKKYRRAIRLGLLASGIAMLIAIVRDTAVLGETMTVLSLPAYEAVRLIDVMDVMTRLEILFAFMLLVMRTFKVSILYSALLRGAREVLHIKKWALWIVGAAIIIGALLFRSGIGMFDWLRGTGMYIFILFEMAFPIVTLITAALRGYTAATAPADA